MRGLLRPLAIFRKALQSNRSVQLKHPFTTGRTSSISRTRLQQLQDFCLLWKKIKQVLCVFNSGYLKHFYYLKF